MLNIEINSNGITMKGHADYAKRGQDIVCASASAVLQYTIDLLEMHTEVEGTIEPGNAIIHLTRTNRDTERLLHVFKSFMKQLERQYPAHIKVFGGM